MLHTKLLIPAAISGSRDGGSVRRVHDGRDGRRNCATGDGYTVVLRRGTISEVRSVWTGRTRGRCGVERGAAGQSSGWRGDGDSVGPDAGRAAARRTGS